MLVLGISGGPDLVHENRFDVPRTAMHDAAAVLIEDGEVLFAIEEERLNRIKHTNKLPVQSMRACLESRGVQLKDVDLIAYYGIKEGIELWIKQNFLEDLQVMELLDAPTYFQQLYRSGLGGEVDASKFYFVHHHLAHAMSAFALSGYESSLITTFDGQGDGSSGMVLLGAANTLKTLVNFPKAKSLGIFYNMVIAYLGYKFFDEYKVMGLAPYGDPERFRKLFRTFYTLLPNGEYLIHENKLFLLFSICTPRRKGEPFTETHKDIAAALQESLEDIAFHVVRHYREKTQQKNLCLAGGVAHNCTLNGKLLRSGMFENVFVQPAAHDAGGALGAALLAYYANARTASKHSRMKHVYWGTDISSNAHILNQLSLWQNFIEYEKAGHIDVRTAELLAGDYVVGWVQGRSEFGPRALGNRSILADPRPAKNKERINQMVKKREGYRPFAPSVLEEEAHRFFEVQPEREDHPFMVFVVNVRKEKQQLLGAITHVDGTARIQTVSRETNEKYWKLIRAFEALTGVPILLNTSFNNNVEPIVDSIEDAIVCFLTTGLDYLVAGDYLVEKKEVDWHNYLSLKASLPPYASLQRIYKLDQNGKMTNFFHIGVSYDAKLQSEVSNDLFHVLTVAQDAKPLRNILEEAGWNSEVKAQTIVQELVTLWSQRLILLRP